MPFTSRLPDIPIPDDISVTDFIVENFHSNPNHQLLIDPFGENSFTNQQALTFIYKVFLLLFSPFVAIYVFVYQFLGICWVLQKRVASRRSGSNMSANYYGVSSHYPWYPKYRYMFHPTLLSSFPS
jgi:hypothetical protein